MILLIDNYDSFTYNLYQYLGEIDPDIRTIRNDEMCADAFLAQKPDKIVISPGPKTPNEAGVCLELLSKCDAHIPILGICLGHQCMAQSFGAVIARAKRLCHGKTSSIKHNRQGVFVNVPQHAIVARYHSLAIVPETLPECFDVTATTDDGEIMAIKHKKRPWIGLQFHPESVFTPDGKTIIRNFMKGEFHVSNNHYTTG